MTELKMKYFVLKPGSRELNDMYAAASRKAMRAYTGHIAPINPELATSLLFWAKSESDRENKLLEYEP